MPDVMSMSVYKLGGPHIGLILSTFELHEEYFGTKDMESIQFALVAIGAWDPLFISRLHFCIFYFYSSSILFVVLHPGNC